MTLTHEKRAAPDENGPSLTERKNTGDHESNGFDSIVLGNPRSTGILRILEFAFSYGWLGTGLGVLLVNIVQLALGGGA